MLRLDAITLKQLRALLAVGRTGTLTQAAEEMSQTPPTIHSQIKNLETAVGQPLLQRAADGSGFRPTPAGRAMLVAAHRIEADMARAARDLAALSQGKSGHVVLGTVSTAKYFAPRLVRLLRDRLPEIEVTLRVANRGEVMAALERDEYDLAIMGRPPRDRIRQAVPLGPHPHGILLPPDHPLARQDGYDPEQLLQETFICREPGSGTRTLMERFLDRLGEGNAPRQIEMQSNETIKQAVIAGLGIAFLSLHTAQEELQSGRLALLRGNDLPVMRHWYLIRANDDGTDMTRSTRRCAEEIEALAGSYLPQITG